MGGAFFWPPMLREGGSHSPPHLSVEGGACFFFRKFQNEGGGHTLRLSVPTRPSVEMRNMSGEGLDQEAHIVQWQYTRLWLW